MLTGLLRDMAAGESTQRLMEQLCAIVRQGAAGRIACVMRLGPDGRLHLLAAAGAAPALVAALEEMAPEPWAGSCAGAPQDAAPVLAADVRHDPRCAEQRALAAHGIRAFWCLPVRQGGRVVGIMALCDAAPGLPGPARLQLLEQAATIAGSLLRLLELQEVQAAQQEAQRRQIEQMQRLIGFNAMLAQVNQLAAGRPNTAALYEGICRIAVVLGGLRLAWIGAPDRDGRFHPMAAFGATGFLDAVLVSADPTLPEGRGLAGTAWREARTVVRQRFAAEVEVAAWRQAAERFGIGAGAALPLLLRGVPQAVLHVYAAEEGILDADLVGRLKELAIDVGRALEAIDQQQHLIHLEALLATLTAQGETLLRARSDTEMLHWTCTHLVGGALFQIVWAARPDTAGVMQALATAGPETDGLTKQRFALDETPPSLVARCWLEERTIVSNDMLGDPGLARYRDLMARSAWRSAAVVPLRRGGVLFAVLALGAFEANRFTPDVVALCERIAALLGHGLDEFDLKQTLEAERRQQFHLARHDVLTGLPNRRQFEEHLGHALVVARRRGTPLAVCMLDIDDFKPINDRFGHAAGDALLRQAALRLRDALRRSDLIARLGGDEFVLAIDDLGSIEGLPQLLGRVSAALAAPFDLGGDDGPVHIGLSAGVAVFPEDGAEPDLLLRRADAALYAVKATKATKAARACNWQRWDVEMGRPATLQPSIDDPYGPEARRLLAATEGIWPVIADGFVEDLYSVLARQKLAAPILTALSPGELAHLKARQVVHLVALMAATGDRDNLRRAARAVGQIHALVGVDSVLMVQALGLYQTHLARHLATQPLRPSERQNLIAVATARLQEDQAEQMEAGARTIAAYFDVLLQRPRQTDALWMDAVQVRLDAMARLPGILSARLLRPDEAGALQTLASSSTAGLPFGGLVTAPGARPTIDHAHPEGRGLLSEVWHGGAVASAANYQTDPRTAPWHDSARRFGVRSAVAVPVHDMDNRPVAVLILFGAVPNQFEAAWARHVCADFAQGFSLLWHQHQKVAAAVIPESTAVAWRHRLFAGGLVMHYQPIVDLRTGKPTKVEALARLVLEDGQVIAPGQFLPLLGMRDLDELFLLGLAEALGQTARWDAEGLPLGVTVNLAPSTLVQPDCVLWVRAALERAQIAPDRLSLEITEDQGLAAGSAAATITALAGIGVNVVMDDLGAGYGSLQRLRRLPFRTAKLDQSLVEDIRGAPERPLSFMGALVQLGHDLGVKIVVEGLETEDLVEAAAILGADAGQGFALGRPMPAEAIAGWARDFVWRVDRKAPRTTLGALAAVWYAAHRSGGHQGPVGTCPVIPVS